MNPPGTRVFKSHAKLPYLAAAACKLDFFPSYLACMPAFKGPFRLTGISGRSASASSKDLLTAQPTCGLLCFCNTSVLKEDYGHFTGRRASVGVFSLCSSKVRNETNDDKTSNLTADQIRYNSCEISFYCLQDVREAFKPRRGPTLPEAVSILCSKY